MDKAKLEVLQGDITKVKVDAIVNAANRSLLGGGGVDGAIHRAAGPLLLEECKRLGGCNIGEAKITKGHKLPARFIIHTVGPIYGRDPLREAEQLANCYTSSLRLAAENNCASIAFPNISTGFYDYPLEEAAAIAIKAVMEFPESGHCIEKVVFVCFDDKNYSLYCQLLH